MGWRTVLPLALLCACAAGCYEIEPQLGKGYVGGPVQPGWPPPPVYAGEPFHPLNRLFHRLYVLGGAPPAGEPVLPARTALGEVDRAEVLALLEEAATGREGFASVSSPAVRSVLQSDLLLFLARYHSGGGADPQVASKLAAAALSLAGGEGGLAAELPPPLRSPRWKEAAAPLAPGLRPSAQDLRWTRVFGGGRELAVVRLRTGVKANGEPVLLPLGSEARLFGEPAGGTPPAPRLFRFRRARLLGGEEPWEEVVEEAVPDSPPTGPAGADLDASRAAQLEDARRALAALPWPGR